MNTLSSDKELSDLLDFSAMFAPPGSLVGKSAGTLAEATLSGSLHSRTGTLDENSTWPSTVSGFDRSYHSDSHALYSSIEDDGDFLARKNSSYSNYLTSNAGLTSLGKSKDPYTTSYSPGYRDPGLGSTQGSSDVSLSSTDWGRSRKYKSSKSNGSLTVYSPGGEDLMSHPGDSVPQSHYSPKGGLYGDSYFIDHGSPDPWGHSAQLGSSSSAYSSSGGAYGNSYGITPREGMKDLHGVPVAALAKGPLPHHHQQRPYHAISHSEMDRLTGLPPMSSFRQTATLHGQSSPYLHSVSPPLNGSDPIGHTSRAPTSGSQTGDALGKALHSIYSTDNGTTYSSNPSTPVGSPPPLASVSERPLSAGSGASGHSSGWGRTNQPTSPPYESNLHPLREAPTRSSGTPMELQSMQGYMPAPPKQSRIEERLDDAIHVLRNHAEANVLPPEMYASEAGTAILTSTASRTGYTTTADSMQSAVSHLDQLSSSHGAIEQDPNMASPGAITSRQVSSQMSPATSEINEGRYGSKDKDKDSSIKAEDRDKLDDQDKGSLMGDDLDPKDDDDLLGNDRDRMLREQERRYANNARERVRVRDINEAFKELGRMCEIHMKGDKSSSNSKKTKGESKAQRNWSLNDASYGSNVPQTKLVILHQAVSVITSLESQVRERNLNPKAACLKRREEEKVEEESPEKRAVPGVDKPFDNSAVRGRGGRRGRRSSRGTEGPTSPAANYTGPGRGISAEGSHGDGNHGEGYDDNTQIALDDEAALND